MAVWHGILLAAELHGVDQAGEQVGRILQRVGLHERVERLQQAHRIGCGAGIEQERHVDGGGPKAGLAKQALVQRAGVERDPVDAHAIALGPVLDGVATLGPGDHRHVHPVRQDGELVRLGLGMGQAGRQSNRGQASGLQQAAAIEHAGLLVWCGKSISARPPGVNAHRPFASPHETPLLPRRTQAVSRSGRRAPPCPEARSAAGCGCRGSSRRRADTARRNSRR
jgi:hypothetical protein